ncbi:MAG: Dcp1p-Dcp2p decapping enzyme complex alpha subunit [Icmadophila ericetorum]|nr:Dcp1p-Dcp2p decapping enzyme complex alpha subunit [Icmadophila ericetorum]
MGGSVPEIPGTKAEGDELHHLRRDVAQLLGRDRPNFPGAQPVSFARRHLFELQKENYFVCEKSDGIRCLMWQTKMQTPSGPQEYIFLIDRKNDYYHVPALHFPLPEDELNFHIATLVDGELVNDRQPDGSLQLKYLVFDCLVLDGGRLMHRTLDKRLAYFREKVFNPYKALYKKYPDELEYVPFIVEFKEMEFSYGIEKMFRDILPNLPHGNDGLIFTCVTSPYKFGTDEHILKWKTANENSIDFLLMLQWPMLNPDSEDEAEGITEPYPDYLAMPTFNLRVMQDKGQYLNYGTMHVEPHEWEVMKRLEEPLDDRIIECYMDEQGRWRYLRFRDDKLDANHISTVRSVRESIEDRVSEMDLIANAKKVRDEWKKRQAVEEARQKQEAAARAAAQAMRPSPAVNGQNGVGRDASSGTKRKLEDGQADGGEKRRLTPLSGASS